MATNGFEITAERANVDLETGMVIISGFDIDELVSEFPVNELLDAMAYSDVVDWVAQREKEREEDGE